MFTSLTRWFKSNLSTKSNNERRRRSFHNDRSLRSYGYSNNYGYKLTCPKTSLQLAEAEFFRAELTQNQEHFNILNSSVLEPLRGYHVDIAEQIRGPNITSWHSFRIQYDVSSIVSSNLYPNAERHLRLDIPNYDNIQRRIEDEINKLNKKVIENEKRIKEKVQNQLSEFSLIYLDDTPTVLSPLEDCWFNKMIHRYRMERIPYQELITQPLLFESKLKEDSNQLMYGATAIAPLTIDKAAFCSKVDELMKDFEIFDLMMDLVRKREQIADLINDYTTHLSRLTAAIHNESYRTLTNCCPSQQVAAIS